MAIVPDPAACQLCGSGGGGGDSADVESLLLCDTLADGTIVGSAIAVYEYDSDGNPVGAPTFVIPGTNTPYVVVGTLQPCDSEGQSAVVELCDVNPLDGSSVQFIRHYIFGPAGTVLSFHDSTESGAPYTPLNTVQDCDPYALCTPDSNLDLNANCGPGETAKQTIVDAAPGAPLANSVFVDDATADPLCGGTWNRGPSALPVGFPVAESFRNTTFDQPGPVVQGTPTPFLTAGPPVNDGAGAGWFREADTSGGSNGLWQVPTAFSTAQGMNAAISWASHDGTIPGGDGQAFVFTDGSIAPQSAPVGGFGNLGLQNWQGGVFAVVLDEYGQTCTCDQTPGGSPNPGPCGFCSNTISIQRAGASRIGATCACCTIASMPLAPKALNQTTRAQPVRVLVSVVTEAGQTYVSASLDWNDGNGPIQYFNRVNITACVTVPATLRMAAYSGSGGAYQAIKEVRDAVARPAGVSNWRAFPITTDPIVCPGPGTPTLVNVSASVDVTPNDDGSQTAGNGNPELYFWLVNTATNTILDSDEYSILPSQLGTLHTLNVSASVPPADVPNLRLYVGDESRDDVGEYDVTWDNMKVTATAAGCPATPRRTLEISARCPIPVAIVSGGSSDSGGGGTTVVNTPSTFEDALICATVGGVRAPAFRREIHLPDGTVDVTFIGMSGLPITPDGGWTAGSCDTPCGQVLGEVCYQNGPVTSRASVVRDCATGAVTYYNLSTGALLVAPVIVICPESTVQFQVLCDLGNTDHQFMRWYVESPVVGFSDTVYDFELDGSTVYVPVGPVALCGGSTRDSEVEVLCDSNGTQFLRKYVYDGEDASFVGILNTTLDGNTAFVPVGAVGTCPVSVTLAENDVETQVLCDSNGTPFLRRYVYDAETPGVPIVTNTTLDGSTAFAPVGAVGVCASTTVLAEFDVEVEVLCDANNTRFLRRYVYDAETPGVPTVTNTLLDGTTAFAPVGAVGVCGPTFPAEFDVAEEVLCDNNGGFIRRFVFNSNTGVLVSTTNLTLAGVAYVPVGTVGSCEACCPIEVGRGCTNVGSLRYTALRLANGTISLIDSVTGAAVLPANVVACVDDDTVRTLTAQSRLLTAGQSWTPGADVLGTLTGLSFTVLSGTANVTDQNGTVSTGLPPGVTGAWNAEDDNTLLGPTTIDAIAGNTWVTWTQR